jgi:methionyl-tRNA formyltransferase
MNIIFLGTSTFAVPILKALRDSANFSVDLVITEPAKPAGRKKELIPSPIAIFAKENNLEIFMPDTLENTGVQEKITNLKPDIMVVTSYGKIIPENIFNIPSFKTINIHPSLLPELRGPSPIQYTFLEGREKTGVTLIVIDKEIDHGPIISQQELSVEPTDNFNTLEQKLADLGAKMIIQDIPKYIAGSIKPMDQNYPKATFTKKIEKQDGGIDWNKSAQEIYNQWRAFIRWPGIYMFLGNIRLNLKKVKIAKDISNKKAGEMFSQDNGLFISCGNGTIEIEEIQPEGKKIMEAQSFINGYQKFLN